MTQATIQFQRPATLHPESALWSQQEIEALYDLPFMELVFRAAEVHRQHFDPSRVQLSTLVSIKTGGCPEDCGYCPQSVHHETAVENQPMMTVDEVVDAARHAKANGAGRFCMGAAWRGPKDADLEKTLDMVQRVKALGLQTCATFGLLKDGQAEKLKDAGLDYYNHNLDTAPDKYADIIQTRDYEDRLATLGKVRGAGLILQLANLDPQPESVPVNNLVQVTGTPLDGAESLDWTEFVRTIAVARLTLPKSYIRLSAGRREMPEAMQALCFLAGANSIFYGDKLLTTGNPDVDADRALMEKLGLQPL